MMHLSLLSCLLASPVDASFLRDRRYHGKGNSKRNTAGNNELEGAHNQMIDTDLLAGIRKETIIILYVQFPRQVE